MEQCPKEIEERVKNICIDIDKFDPTAQNVDDQFLIEVDCDKCKGTGKMNVHNPSLLRNIRAFANMMHYQAASLFNMLTSMVFLSDIESGRRTCTINIYEKYKQLFPIAKNRGRMYKDNIAVGEVWFSKIKVYNEEKEYEYIVVAISENNIWLENTKNRIMKKVPMDNFLKRFTKRYETPLNIKGYNV